MTPAEQIKQFLDECHRTYTSVIPGVMDSRELADTRKLISLCRGLLNGFETDLNERSMREGDALSRAAEIVRGNG